MQQNNILVIAGMHRSGTSMITHWLHECGLNVGRNLMDAGIGNTEGHYEDMEFYQLHVDHLRINKLPYTGFIEKAAPAFSPKTEGILKDLIAAKNKEFAQWGWKDPRTCLFLNAYEKLLPDAKYLIIFRDFSATVSSMISRIFKQKDIKHSKQKWLARMFWIKIVRKIKQQWILRRKAQLFLRAWLLYNRNLLELASKIDSNRYTVINYKTLLKDDTKIFSTLKDKWHFSLKYVNFSNIYKPKLLSDALNVESFTDKQLLSEAQAVMQSLEALAQKMI